MRLNTSNVIRIITETGLRLHKELAPMRKDQVDLANGVAWVPEAKTPSGAVEVLLTEIAVETFKRQREIAGKGLWLFPCDRSPLGNQQSFKKVWSTTLRKAAAQYFRCTICDRLTALG